MKFLIPTAGRTPAERNAPYVLGIAKKLGAEVFVLHILDPGEDDTEGREALDIYKKVGKELGVKVLTHIMEGNVVPTIVDFAEGEGVNLIAMGASRGNIIAEWVVTDVLEKTNIPVVILPYGFPY